MINARITYAKLNDEKTANALLHYFEKIRQLEVKYMRRDDPRAWKAGKESINGIKI